MRVIKYTYRDVEDIDDGELKNRDAVLRAYRQRELKVDDKITVWFAGHLTMGPLSRNNFDFQHVIDNIPKWTEQFGPGRIWIEDPSPAIAKMQSAAIMPFNEHSHHMFELRARLIGSAQFTFLRNILDDTGSTYLELFRDDDCQWLSLTRGCHFWMPNVLLDTANGLVTRRSIELEVQLVVNGAPFGNITRVRATITPGFGGDQLRCSGMFLRNQLFTATSPYGQGVLYISDRKTGVTQPLPAA
ncbi:hypothetical protein VTN96DRAFT_10177 [Rasamsonia emersonii]